MKKISYRNIKYIIILLVGLTLSVSLAMMKHPEPRFDQVSKEIKLEQVKIEK